MPQKRMAARGQSATLNKGPSLKKAPVTAKAGKSSAPAKLKVNGKVTVKPVAKASGSKDQSVAKAKAAGPVTKEIAKAKAALKKETVSAQTEKPVKAGSGKSHYVRNARRCCGGSR